MAGLPLVWHLGPVAFHLYGLGLGVATLVAYEYARRRLGAAGVDLTPFGAWTGAVLVAGLVGARVAHVATNWSYYSHQPAAVVAVWNGGLASFGGIALALPVGLWLCKRWWPTVDILRFTDALVPALLAGWALGRVLGPQFMSGGGGHLTHQWFGMHYHGQVGTRVPVPLIQGAEDGLLWALLVFGPARWWRVTGRRTAVAMISWGVVRSLDERLLLGQHSHSGSLGVQLAGLALAVGGLALLVRRRT